MSKRLEFSRKTKRIINDRADGACEKCKAVLKPGEGEVDHILSCEMGGQPTVANGRLLCKVCHKEKTASDIRSIRHSDRMRDKNSGVIKAAGKIRGAGFPKQEKPQRPAKDTLPALPRRQLYQEIQR
jgi:5-methylcytosine-specific restriction endonuclease McrA